MAIVTRIQPQGLARLNPANRLAQGAQAVVSGFSRFNLVSGQPLTVGGSGIATSVVGAGYASVFRQNYYLESELLPAIGTASCVDFWYGIPRGLLNRGGTVGGASANVYAFGTGSSNNQIGIFFGGGSLATPSWGAVSNWSAVNDTGVVLTVGVPTLLVMVRRQDRMELWRDGNLTQTFTQSPASWGAAKLVLGGFIEDTAYWSSSSDTILAGRLINNWSSADVQSFSQNPWQIFQAPQRPMLAATATGAAAGTLAWTEQNDTTAITGVVTTVGSLAWTEANDGGAINATVTNAGSLAWTEANDANALSATVTNAGALAWTEASDTTAISGTVTSSGATLSWAEQNDANALNVTVTNAGSLAWTEQSDVTAINAAQPVPATLSWTEQNDVCAIIGAALVAGSLAWAEQDDFTQIVAKGPSTGGGADYGDKKKRRKVIIDGKQYKVTEPELASLLAIKQEEAEQASQKAAKAVAKVTKPAAQAISENAADAVLMRRIADDLADEDDMEDLLMMLL